MAHITCTAEKVKLAAEATIANIIATRTKKDENEITETMGKKHFWSRKPFTREDAINWLDKNNFFGWRSEYAWGDLVKARNLLILAQHGDPVVIDEDSARVLFG